MTKQRRSKPQTAHFIEKAQYYEINEENFGLNFPKGIHAADLQNQLEKAIANYAQEKQSGTLKELTSLVDLDN